MKNKKFTYLLLTCVAAIWGIVFFKIYETMAEEELPIMPIETEKTAYFKLINHENDKIELKLNYRNPFSEFNNEPIIEPSKIQVPTNIIATKAISAPKINWAEVQYTGYINNPSTKQKIAILLVNGKEFMLAQGQSLNGIKLLKYANDSVKVQYQNDSKYIKIK